jgi:hypothetical protein
MFSQGRKVAVALAFVLLASGGILGLSQLQTARSYEQTTGTVTTATLDTYDRAAGTRTDDPETMYQPNVSYTYTVDGETYTANTIAFGSEIEADSRGYAENVISNFEADDSVTVYYDPANPADAYLIPRLDFLPAGGLIIAGLLLFADSLTPWSRVTRAVLRRIPLSMHLGGRFSTESANAIAVENPMAILEARETMEAPRTAPIRGANASAVWLVCCLGIVLTVVGYFSVSRPPYGIWAYAALAVPAGLNASVLVRVARS